MLLEHFILMCLLALVLRVGWALWTREEISLASLVLWSTTILSAMLVLIFAMMFVGIMLSFEGAR